MISASANSLLTKLKNQKPITAYSQGDGLINVNKLTEKAGAAYEKLRYLIDYKDERHIRRSAIERIIKRKILLEGEEGIGLSLIQELIAGRYLPNNAISEKASFDIDKIILKYKKLWSFIPENARDTPQTKKIVVSLMGSEIEDFFYPNHEDDFVAESFYQTVRESIHVDTLISDKVLDTQTIIACYRSLFNTDDETLFYKLWLKSVGDNWHELENDSELHELGINSEEIWHRINTSLKNELSYRLMPKLYNFAIYFSIVREVVRSYGAESDRILNDEQSLKQFTRKFLEQNYTKQYKKASGSAIRAVFYILITKILLAVALEVPFQLFITKNIEYTPVIANVVFHPILLMLITISVRPLGEKNTEAIVKGVENILSGENVKIVKIKAKGGGFFNNLFLFLYSLLFALVFGSIVFVLSKLEWSVVSIALFLGFLTLISYFALRIRHSANKWKVATEDERLFSMMFNLFALPIVRAGKWLSRKFSSINLFAFVLDFIIETPFKLVLHFSDAFVSFLKEKQEDVY